MLLNTAEVPIRLAMLDQAGTPISDVSAQVVHLDDTYALVSIDEPGASKRIHWGTPVRFEIDDAMKRYEVTGTVVARHETTCDAAPIDDPAVSDIPTWDLRIRIWDCKMNVQRRLVPRRRIGFAVQLLDVTDRPLDPETELRVPVLARCVDIGAGGIRVRTQKLPYLPTRMRLEFCLPVSDCETGHEEPHKFSLAGRVIRALPQGRQGDNMDIAFCFEGLTVRDGMALHNLLA